MGMESSAPCLAPSGGGLHGFAEEGGEALAEASPARLAARVGLSCCALPHAPLAPEQLAREVGVGLSAGAAEIVKQDGHAV